MLKIPKQKIVERILKETQISAEDIESRIQRKLKELSGLISEEGAAHIIANELGVSIFTTDSNTPLKIEEIFPGMRSVTTCGKVLKIYPVNTFTRNGTQGKVQSLLIADQTGQIRCAAWHQATEKFSALKEGDIIGIANAMARDNQGRCELSINDSTIIQVNPAEVTIANITTKQAITAKPTYLKDITRDMRYISILGTLVQTYPPAFFVPKDQREQGKEYTLEEKKSCVANYIIDDGTGTLRVAVFTDQLTQFLEHTVDELKNEEIQKSCRAKTLGRMVFVEGRVNFNEQFQRLELTVQNINLVNAQQADNILDSLPDVT